MTSFNLTALTRETPLIQRKAKTRNISPRKPSKPLKILPSIHSSFQLSFYSVASVPEYLLQTRRYNISKKAMAEINSQFSFNEDQEMETQPIYLSSDESEIDSRPPSPIPQLPNNVPDTYNAITQLTAAHHEQMSLSGTSAPQYPITPPTSLISDDEDDDMLTPITGNPVQFLPYTPNRHPIPIQLCQQITPIPDTPESPTPKIVGNQTSSVPTTFPTNRHQVYYTILPLPRQSLMDYKT